MAFHGLINTVYALWRSGYRVSIFSEARDYVLTALAPLGVNVYVITPQAGVTPPSVEITASNNWLTQRTLRQFAVNLDLKVTAQPAGTNQSAMERLEDLVAQIAAIFPLNGSVSAPTSEKIGQADVLTTIVPITVQVTE